MKPVLVSAVRPLLVILLAIAAGFAASHPGGATHTYSPDIWWVDLKPWGDGSISYALCAIPYELPPEWEWGVENWDGAISPIFMRFDLEFGGCSAPSADTWLAWELGNECRPGAVACFNEITSEDHGTWRELKRTHIYFDHDEYNDLGYWEDAWQVAASAHEWGHNLNLADHDRDQCGEPDLIMGQVWTIHSPCLTGPSTPEVNAVVMNYGLFDSDGDDFVDAVEIYVGTDPLDDCADTLTPNDEYPDPWPPDFDDDTDCDIIDVLKFKPHMLCFEGDPCYDRRFDLDADGDVDIADVLLLKPYILTSCAD